MSKLDKSVKISKLEEYNNALDRFARALQLPHDSELAYLDASAHRFMICYDLTWKILRRFLQTKGIEVNSPMETFRQSYQEQLIDDKDIFKKMVEDRNIVTHEYFQEAAEGVYKRLPDYLKIMQNIYKKMRELYKNEE